MMMESLDKAACFMDDLLDFSSDIGEVDDDDADDRNKAPSSSPPIPDSRDAEYPNSTFPEFTEELEWLSNKDAFPAVETFVDILPGDLSTAHNHHQSPISVLENSTSNSSITTTITTTTSTSATIMSCCGSLQVPVRARSKRRRRGRRGFQAVPDHQLWLLSHHQPNAKRTTKVDNKDPMGRKCQHCHAEKTPQWRAGPLGPKTLCNACGVRFKSGRLVPEYRPASSPTFSSEVHSNSHRKIIEMRRQKQTDKGL